MVLISRVSQKTTELIGRTHSSMSGSEKMTWVTVCQMSPTARGSTSAQILICSTMPKMPTLECLICMPLGEHSSVKRHKVLLLLATVRDVSASNQAKQLTMFHTTPIRKACSLLTSAKMAVGTCMSTKALTWTMQSVLRMPQALVGQSTTSSAARMCARQLQMKLLDCPSQMTKVAKN